MGHIELGNKAPLPQEKDLLYAQWFAKQREGSFFENTWIYLKGRQCFQCKDHTLLDKMLVANHMKRNKKVSLYYKTERYTREVPKTNAFLVLQWIPMECGQYHR